MADEASFCKHCKRLVPSATFILHSTHCERFIQICQQCEEPIPRAQMDQHEHEVHKLINCKDCNERIEKRAENDHLANHCLKRLIPCGYCEIQCLASTVQDHELACGSRTEQCDICKNHILVRMLKIHEELHNSSSIKPTNQVKIKDKSSGQKELPLNVGKNVVIPKFRNVVCQNILQASAALPTTQQSNMNGSSHTSENEMENQPKSLLPCEFCGTLYLVESLHQHQMACNLNTVSCMRGDASVPFERSTDHSPASSRAVGKHVVGPCGVDDDYWSRYTVVSPATEESMVDEEASIPCEICENLFPISCLELHQIACKFSNVSVETEGTIRKKETATQRPASPCGADEDYWSQYAAIATVAEQDKAMEEISVPCENCGTVLPISSLDIHEISCKFSNVSNQSEQTSGVREQIGSRASTSQHYTEPEPALLPCSFCNIIVSSSILEMHEARCRPFSEQQLRRSRLATASTAHLGPKKTPAKNTRIENVAQRSLRNNALAATVNRLPTTPKIKQSQYAVVQLPDGQEILKKRNPSFDTNGPDVGHVLGHGQPEERRDNGSLFLHTAIPTNRTNRLESPNFGFKNNTMETNKSSFDEYDREKYSTGPISRAGKNHASGAVQKQNAVQKNDVILPMDPSMGMRITKKPNAAFKNYAYQPDSGNKLGGGNSSIRDRPQTRNAMAVGTSFRPENTARYLHQNQRDGGLVSGDQRNERDYNNALGARPKMRPQQPADKFHS